MHVEASSLPRPREYFQITVPASAVASALGRDEASPGPLVLDLHPASGAAARMRRETRAFGVVPYSHAARDLVALVTAPGNQHNDRSVDVLLPRAAFDQVADAHGAARIEGLDLPPDATANDDILVALGACLSKATEPDTPNRVVVDQLTAALTTHVAERYGGLQPPAPPASGGLAPWQLRLARETLDAHTDGTASIGRLAGACGLSVGHFTRAFTRSTGLAPHRWLMRRRVEVAKRLMEDPRLSLAEVALTCGFSDQSHFTRAFAAAEGATPGRWRRACGEPN